MQWLQTGTRAAHISFEEARREAERADEELSSGRKDFPPFFGVPITIKVSENRCVNLDG